MVPPDSRLRAPLEMTSARGPVVPAPGVGRVPQSQNHGDALRCDDVGDADDDGDGVPPSIHPFTWYRALDAPSSAFPLNNDINGLSSDDRTHHSLFTISLTRNFDYIALKSFV